MDGSFVRRLVQCNGISRTDLGHQTTGYFIFGDVLLYGPAGHPGEIEEAAMVGVALTLDDELAGLRQVFHAKDCPGGCVSAPAQDQDQYGARNQALLHCAAGHDALR
jgi:hypothetical protein